MSRASAPRAVAAAALASALLAAVPAQEVRRGAGPPELHLVPKKGTAAVVRMPGRSTSRWVTVSELERLAIATGERPLQVLPVAATGSHTWHFAPDGERVCRLPLPPDLRDAWREEGVLRIVFEPGTKDRREVRLRARAEKLHLATDPAPLTVVQRKRAAVPGSGGYLWLSLGDITGGQVLVEITDAEGGVVLARQSMRQGGEARFKLGDAQYVLGLRRLVNFLIGDDFGEFTVGTRSDDTERRIAAVLAAMEASTRTFVRNGTEYDGRSAAEFLRRKYALQKAARSFERFVENVASRSSTTGRPYLVRGEDGSDQPLARWLIERDASLEKARELDSKKPPDPGK